MKIKSRIVKYFYNNLTLYQYCKFVKINYNNVIRSMIYYKNNFENMNNLISYVVSIYLNLKIKKEEKMAFRLVFDDKLNVSYISKKLKIDRSCIYKVRKAGFSLKNSILLIYFLYDNNSLESKSLSKKKLKMISNELSTKNYSNNLEHLICYYYMGFEDAFINLTKILQKSFLKNIQKFIYNNNYYIRNIKINKEDIISDLNIYLLQLLKNKKILSYKSNQIKSYINKCNRQIILCSLKEIRKAEYELVLEY